MSHEADPRARLAADAAVTAGLLEIGGTIFAVSGVALAMLLAVWLMGHPVRLPALAGAAAAALAQAAFALRVRFDAGIFRLWAARWHQGADPAADLAAFDARVGRQTPPAPSLDANLADRRRGARRLLGWQAICGAVQLALTVRALWT